MTDKIVTIHSITSADGWFIDSGLLGSAADCVPVCFFALVTLIDTAHDFVDTLVVPVVAEDIEDFRVGAPFDRKSDNLIHAAKLKEKAEYD